jgi:membrane protein
MDATMRRVVREARTLGIRDGVALLRDAFDRNELLTYASAISFQLFFALIPLVLFALGLLGGSGLQGVWSSEIAPQLRGAMSPPAFQVLNDTVREILSKRQLFWVTAGALLAVWKMSGALRAVMSVLDRVYQANGTRSVLGRMAVSIGLGAAVIALLIVTAATMEVLPRVIAGDAVAPAVDILRWPVALVLVWGTIALVVRVAPAAARPPGLVTFGSTLVALAWFAASTVFAWYLSDIADYGSVFGALATLVVVLTYVYISTIAFVTGVQVDALVQERLSRRR